MTVRLTWEGSRASLDALDVALTELMDPPADAVSLVKGDAAEADADTAWQLHAYFAEGADEDALAAALGGLTQPVGEPISETLEERDWVAHALEGLGVVEAGPFIVFGSHDAGKVADRQGHLIQVEANRAFGTGHHPTTEGCLAMLASISGLMPERMLDLGTGSGLLAIAGRRLWPHTAILATDIDVPSVAIAEENADINAVQGIRFAVADGVDQGVRQSGPYGCIAANILADPLIELAPDIADVLARDGRLILAGLLARQEAAVVDAYTAQGLSVVSREGEAWPVLLLARHG